MNNRILLSAFAALCVTITLSNIIDKHDNAKETTVAEISTVAESTIEETTFVSQETTTEELTTVRFEDLPEYEPLGTYKLTAYCSCSKCCGKSDGITASGTKAKAGRTIAASRQFSFGTELMINGNTYTVEDRGGFGENTIDIYMDSHEEALEFGVRYAKVYEVIG